MKYLFVFILMVFSLSVLGEDFEYNTGGVIGYVADLSGSSAGWGEWFITSFYNDTGHDLVLIEFGFPCCGTVTGDFGWVVWVNMPDTGPPADIPESCDYHGPFTPVEGPGGDPSVYTYINVSGESIVILDQTQFVFGYQNTDLGGQTPFTGTVTWSWHEGVWASDENHYRTAVLQVKANFNDALDQTTWGAIKNTFF
ncbi:MAG: hypothetical protein K8R76_12440 [Candidatus Aegiribacteria sp.]|nr:hypothetical protein [Candidatus Aegiribacteria sp.]